MEGRQIFNPGSRLSPSSLCLFLYILMVSSPCSAGGCIVLRIEVLGLEYKQKLELRSFGHVAYTYEVLLYIHWFHRNGEALLETLVDDETRRGRDGSRRGGDAKGRFDGLLWHKDLGHHVGGEFSMAVIQANNLLEDYSQLESGPLSLLDSGPCGTFIGVYDGHGGPETSRSILDAIDQNRNGVKKHITPILDVSRSIGDAYLKRSEFNKEPLLQKFRLSEPFSKPILSAEPSIFVHRLNPRDQFLIFASDGLWEHLTNQEAVDIVNSYPRRGIARRLVKGSVWQPRREKCDQSSNHRPSPRSCTVSIRGGGGGVPCSPK
ncbi:UNVERIFIED_CONTAM: putative protein phosphatase 2C 60 [Sesamum angustifolium]|uniref:protein-serine/threonine phosphatase n=1 Tax=Sesamum angustifolium TaxID=2727405 RepID=A0AAW2MR98_9LAMI